MKKGEYNKETIKWCEMQIKRWENSKRNDFRDGVISGYSWMKQHLEHIKRKGKGCHCPK